MFSYSIKQLRNFITQSRIPTKSILISYCSPLVLYTFLNINTSVFNRELDQSVKLLASRELTQFLFSIKNQISILKRIQEVNYPYIDIQSIHKNNESSNKIINIHKENIKQTANLCGNLTSAILTQARSDNFINWMEICLKLHLIDIRIWSHFIKLAHQNSQTLSEMSQLRILKAIHTYLETFFMKNTYAPNKFIFRENLISDIYYLQDLIIIIFKKIIKKSLQSISSQLQQSLDIVVTLITKIKRGLIFNLYQMQKHCKSHQKEFVNLIQNGNIYTVFSIMKYISLLGIYNMKILQNIENKLTIYINKNQKVITFQEKYSLTITVLKVWNTFHYNNPKIYQTLVRPVLIQLLEADSDKTPINTSIIFNMICSNLKEQELLQKLMNKVTEKHPIQSKTAHIISHYLGIENKTKNLSSYPHCYQNKLGLQIAQKHKFVYSNCMLRSSQQHSRKLQYKPHHVTFEETYGKKNNPPEQFWLSIIQSLFKQLTIKYPHVNNQLISNFSFCVFQIDALLVLNEQYLAFQYQGLHYKIQNVNQDKQLLSKGNKLIKQKIIQAYGVKILQIDSSDPIIRSFAAFRDKKNGAKYLRQKIEQLYLSKLAKEY